MTLPRRCPTGIRRPLVGAALCAAAGLAAGARLPALAPAAVLAAAFSALGLAAALHVLSRRISGCAPWATGVVFLSLALAFWANLALRVHPVLPRELANLMDRPREGLEAVGLVAGDPVVRAEPGGADERLEFALRLERIRRLPAWQAARGRVSVRFRARPGGPRPQYGDRWLLAGPMTDWARFPTPRPAVDWMGRRYTMSAEGGDARRLAEGQGAPWLAWLFRARQAAARNLERGLLEHRPDVAGLMKALLLGYRQELDPVQRQVFLTTGTYHIFAISGQHVAILALFVLVVLQAGGIGRSHWVLAAAPLLAAFTIATGLSASAVRGCAMAVMVFLAFWLNRKPDIPSALAAAALLILAADPSQLFQIGFLLSFAVVAGLVVLCPPLLAATRPSLQPDPWRLASEPWAVRAARSLWRGVILLAVSSLAAWLVSAPLIARWFNLVSPVALAANLAVVPASSLVLLAGCLSVLTGSLFPGMGEVFNYAAVPVVSALLAVLGGLARLPGGYWPVAAPPAWSLAVWYASLLAWLPGWGGWRWRAAGPAILAAAALSAAGLQARRFEAEVFNLGGEPVCFVRAPGLGRVLAQAGPSWTGLRLAAQLERRGIARLDAVLLPYPEAARAGGITALGGRVRISELRIPPDREPTGAVKTTLRDLPECPVRTLGSRPAPGFSSTVQAGWDAESGTLAIGNGRAELRLGPDRIEADGSRTVAVQFGQTGGAGPGRTLTVRCIEPGWAGPAPDAGTDPVLGLGPADSVRLRWARSAGWQIVRGPGR